ncbi:hypothetical protein FF011L_54230 [Roseimaritima multifibrata]|uniref:Uncharacterized protein n=1 Tax=Roseimaritima multifibrata TaxID=1930274 RepID=A0A517MP03_9BACT|nr:hypothetical protein FF011L_54230 [Roseimaritima multifibrata]
MSPFAWDVTFIIDGSLAPNRLGLLPPCLLWNQLRRRVELLACRKSSVSGLARRKQAGAVKLPKSLPAA